MEPKTIDLTLKVIFSRSIFESAGFFLGVFLGVTAGFMLGYVYVVFPWGVP